MSKQYVIVDIETTGMKRDYHGITEIAAVRFDGDRIVEEWQTLIDPEMYIPPQITAITWITNAMVKGKPCIKDVLREFYDFLANDVFVAHNASFDRWFLDAKTRERYRQDWTHEVLCTRKLANRVIPHLQSKSLASLCQYFGVTNRQAHRAMADVLATTQILKNLITLCQQYHGKGCIETLLTVQSLSVSKAKQLACM